MRFPLFMVLAGIILLGPVYGHFFATGSHAYIGWKMFSRKATVFCAVDYWEVVEGERRPVDRFALLPKHKSKALRRITTAKRARKYGREMCKALGPGKDLRLRLKCGERAGWGPETGGERNLCTR